MGDITPISEDRGSPRPNGEPIRFGAFELDLRTCELRKGSRPVKIVGQPYAVLVTLVERPGEIITREELQQKLWASDTFVDFEHGLNAAVNKLREALGDNAENPRYIETLPRRGYRFIGPLDGCCVSGGIGMAAPPERIKPSWLRLCGLAVISAIVIGVLVWAPWKLLLRRAQIIERKLTLNS